MKSAEQRIRELKIAIDENIVRRNLSDAEFGGAIKQLDVLNRELYGENKGGQRTDLGHGVTEVDGWSLQKTADLAGVSKATVVKAIKIATTIEKYPDLAKKSGQRVLTEYKRRTVRQATIQRGKESPDDGRFQLIEGDLATEYKRLPPESINVIITDPPYSEKYLGLYATLAEASKLLLKSGGSLLVMTGQSHLPDVLNRLTPHLTYHWLVAYLTPGGQSPQIWQRKVNTFWKPVLWFTKGAYAGEWVGDVVKSAVNDNDKTYHQWGQSESGFTDLLKRFTKEGDVVLDPFMGAGTTGVVAVQMGRQFIGIDISADHVSIARGRIQRELDGRPTGKR